MPVIVCPHCEERYNRKTKAYLCPGCGRKPESSAVGYAETQPDLLSDIGAPLLGAAAERALAESID